MNVDEAALDAFLASDGTPAAAPVEEAAPVVEAPVAEAPETPEAPVSEDKFDRTYVEKLRRESAGYRERAKRYQEAFDGYESEAVEEFLDLARQLRADPRSTADRFQELADAIRSQYGDAAGDAAEEQLGVAPASAVAESTKPMTRAEFEAMWAEKEREADINRRVAQIEADATGLGYTKGSEAYERLLWTAGRLPTGSIQEAHAKLQAERQAVIDSYVAEMGGRPAPQVPSDGVPATGERKIRTFAEANEALEAFLSNQA